MLAIALTGSIGSGKSAVAKLFHKLGIAIISADKIARDIVEPGMICYQNIVSRFGGSIAQENLQLDRKKLRDIIFNDPEQKVWLEQLLHPVINLTINDEISLLSKVSSPPTYCIIEIPLLKSKQAYPMLDRVILVTINRAIQLSRVRARDKTTDDKIKQIIDSQPSNEIRKQLADDLIENNGSLVELAKKINQLHQFYTTMKILR